MKIFKKILSILFLLAVLFFVSRIVDFDFSKFSLKPDIKKKEKAFVEEKYQTPILRNEEQDQIQEREFQGTELEIIELVNQARFKEELPALKKNEKLMQSALLKAEDMKEKNYFEHVSPEGLQPWFFAEKIGYKYKTFGENLAEGFFNSQSVHEAWMNSAGHRKNILGKDFEEIGIGITGFEQNGMKSYIIVQHFASKLAEKDLEPQVVCDQDVKESCENANEKEKEIDDVVDEQKKEIKKAKKAGASKEDIEKMEDNLDDLEEMDDNIDEYLDDCENYIKKCDKWE